MKNKWQAYKNNKFVAGTHSKSNNIPLVVAEWFLKGYNIYKNDKPFNDTPYEVLPPTGSKPICYCAIRSNQMLMCEVVEDTPGKALRKAKRLAWLLYIDNKNYFDYINIQKCHCSQQYSLFPNQREDK